MSLLYVAFVVLLSCCGLRYVDCEPSFTATPNSGNDVYVLDGASFEDLIWNYNSDGFTLEKVELLYFNPDSTTAIVAKKLPSSQQLQIFRSSGYSGRVQIRGSATFRILNIIPSDSRTFQCRVTFTNADPPEIQNNAKLVVVVPPSIKPQLPSSVTLDEGDTRTLICVASGNPKPSYTWRKDSSSIPQPLDSNYTITSANKDHAGTYTCTAQVSAPGLGTYSKDYIVEVIVRFRPQVTFLSSNQSLNDGLDAEFLCQAEAYPTAITYSWFKGGNPITDGQFFIIDMLGSRSRLRAKQITKNSAGQYSCSGRNDLGIGERKSTFLAVNYAPQTVTVTTDLVPADVPLSQSITLTCQADGYPDPSFSWKFNGKIRNGAQKKTLLLANVEVKDAGNYTCIATNFRGSKETTKVVNVEYRPTKTILTTGTPGNAVVRGTKVTLTCSADGYPAPTFTIRRGSTEVSNSGGRVDIDNVQLNDEDEPYSCVPSNKVGDGPTEQITIIVLVPPTFNPASTLPTTKQTKNENETMSYSCTADAKPAATILWVLNGQNLTRTPLYNISGPAQSIPGSKLLRTFSYLTINQLTWRQHGNFSCIAYNDAGQTRQNTELEVKYRPVVQFPADHPQNLTRAVGETAIFTCKTIGNPPTTTQRWQFNGVDIPGESESCNPCTSIKLTKASVSRSDEGWYSCIGTNSMGDGPPARAQLLIKREPKIPVPSRTYTVNETNNVTMVCEAEGVPKPTITWRKTSDQKIVGNGEKLTILNTKGSDDGEYTCVAKNDLGKKEGVRVLNVQITAKAQRKRARPIIKTSTPEATNIPVPAKTGDEVKLTCIVSAKPSAEMSWKRDLNGNELISQIANKVKSISRQVNAIEMTLSDAAVDEEFYCVAVNFLGNDTQKYRIRERGPPDPPIDVKLVGVTEPEARTVSVKVSWTPGYSGGFAQQFSIHYRKKGSNGDFTEESVGNPENDVHIVKGLSPNTEYEFMLQASNERGKSQTSLKAQVMTPESAIPPLRGTVKATRSSDDPTVIIVTWTVTDKNVTKLSLEIEEGGEEGDRASWERVPRASDMSTSKTEYKVENLKAKETYQFRMDMRRPREEELDPCEACYVISNKVVPAPVPEKQEKEGLQNWMIAVIAAVAGVLLIAIVVLVLCCFKRRKKPQGADNVNMSQTSSYVVGGPEVSRSLDTRPRSYGMESVEDDPFIEAHFASMQSMNSADGKKKKADTGVNYGYLSQDSVQPNQPEMLLNPGSRLPRNHPVAQSTGDLDAHSAYPARGPQRDFSTLPPYHEPPSFEEAMRQSGRKAKTAKSTGDLAGPGPARHSGRRPRHSPSDEPTDSSDGELRYTPQRTAPPPPRVRHVQSRGDPGYAEVDQGRVLAPRVLPQGPPATSAPRNGPLDPTVPYAVPQKKKSKKPRSEPSEPAIDRLHPPPSMYGPPFWKDSYKGWPPPQYTPEDRSPEEPMHHPGDLDLDDPSTLPPSERPPDLPPPMAMLPSNRRMPSYEDDLHDGLPEPPAFLRDVVYPPDGREPLHDIGGPAPYHPPPSSGRQRQPYVNIHGQLVRPPSRGSDDFRRPDSLRSSRDALTPEPEMPPRQRGSESDDRGAPEINYVSYLV